MSDEPPQTQDNNSSPDNQPVTVREPIPIHRLVLYGIVIAVFIFSAVLYCRVYFASYPAVVRGGAPITDIPRFTPRKSFKPTPGTSVAPSPGISTAAVSPVPGGSVSSSALSSPVASPVNINTASAADLEELPGIGKKRAEEIIKYRTAHGPFKTPEDIRNVEGIGEKTFERLKGMITLR